MTYLITGTLKRFFADFVFLPKLNKIHYAGLPYTPLSIVIMMVPRPGVLVTSSLYYQSAVMPRRPS